MWGKCDNHPKKAINKKPKWQHKKLCYKLTVTKARALNVFFLC